MALKPESSHNPLSIRLTESAVFVRSNENLGRRHAQGNSRPSILRGLLTMHLTKPTKISSIELQLSCNTSISWPEGSAKLTDDVEEQTVFSRSTTFFRAAPQTSRRHASVGPGISLHDQESNADEWQYLHPAALSQDIPHAAREASSSSSSEAHSSVAHDSTTPGNITPPPPPPRSQSCHPHEFPPTPPYTPEIPSTPFQPSLSRNASSSRSHENPAQTLEDFRNALRAELHHDHGTRHSFHLAQIGMSADSSSSSLNSYPGSPLSRRHSIEDVPEDEAPSPSSPTRTQPNTPHLANSEFQHHHPHHQQSTTGAATTANDRHEVRGRHHNRFSLASIIDAVRSKSPRMKSRKRVVSRDNSPEPHAPPRPRGRAMVMEEEPVHSNNNRPTLSMLGGILKHDDHETHNQQQETRHWKVFKPGVYNYPVSFSIPGNSPPSLICPYGHVTWELKAKVRRPGAFTSNMTATQVVTVVTCPSEDDTEESENIMVERSWESQLQYMVSISGRCFYIGGTIPIHVALMPLTKVKIYRISVMIEEKITYLSHKGRASRVDPITRLLLLSVRHEDKEARPIFPLESHEAHALKHSPLAQLLSEDDDVSEKAAEFMGPGPWTFHQDLKLPTSCSTVTFTNKNKKSNMIVSHSLKVILRVERGDDNEVDQNGKPKLFDIVIQAPVTILSCRCNPEWTSLPRYTEDLADAADHHRACPCDPKFTVQRVDSSDSRERLAVQVVHVDEAMQAMIDQSEQFERLMSGQETESGEHPPTYESVQVS